MGRRLFNRAAPPSTVLRAFHPPCSGCLCSRAPLGPPPLRTACAAGGRPPIGGWRFPGAGCAGLAAAISGICASGVQAAMPSFQASELPSSSPCCSIEASVLAGTGPDCPPEASTKKNILIADRRENCEDDVHRRCCLLLNISSCSCSFMFWHTVPRMQIFRKLSPVPNTLWRPVSSNRFSATVSFSHFKCSLDTRHSATREAGIN